MSPILLDPTSERRPVLRERAPRIGQISGKTIGLLDISKARGNVFLDRLEERFREQGANIERFRKPTFAKPAPIDLRQEIAKKVDALVEALAD